MLHADKGGISMRAYRPSHRAPLFGLIVMLVLGAIAAVAVGMALWAAENLLNFYLILAFPALAGFLMGAILAFSVRAGKVRSPFIAFVIAVLAGVLAIFTYHFAGYYITFRGQAREIMAENGFANSTEEEITQFVDLVLQEEVGEIGFIGYMQLAAREGISITRSVSSSSSGVPITGTGVWIYWGVELLIVAIIGAVMARNAAAHPFNESTNSWLGQAKVVAVAPINMQMLLLKDLEAGDYPAAGAKLTRNTLKPPMVAVSVYDLPETPEDDAVLEISRITIGRRSSETSVIKRGVLQMKELERLVAAIPQT